jgi:hypothetical protein
MALNGLSLIEHIDGKKRIKNSRRSGAKVVGNTDEH